MARRHGARIRRRARKRRSTWSLPSRRGNASCWGQVKVNEKSNEIIAIPALLDMMSIEGAVVTIDAMGCQLYDPLSVKVDTSRTGTHYIRTPLPGNILPASYINMGAKTYNAYTKYWPDPNNWLDHTKSQTTGATDYQSGDTDRKSVV